METPTKRVLIGCLGAVGAATLLVVAVAAFAFYRMRVDLDARKPELRAIANRFVLCLHRDDVACLESVTNWDGYTLRKSRELEQKIASKLGQRLYGTVIDASWQSNSKLGTGARQTFTFQMRSVYERDRNVTESFILVEDEDGLRVEGFHVNSQMLME